MTRGAVTEPIDVLDHAVERFIERVRPGLEVSQAHSELDHLLAIADYVFEAPEWLASRAQQRAPMYAVIADIVLPLQIGHDSASLVVVTCLARGGVSGPARERRNRARIRKTAGHCHRQRAIRDLAGAL